MAQVSVVLLFTNIQLCEVFQFYYWFKMLLSYHKPLRKHSTKVDFFSRIHIVCPQLRDHFCCSSMHVSSSNMYQIQVK